MQPRRSEREPVAVGRREPKRALLVAVGVAVAFATGNDEVVLERAGPDGKRRLGLEVGADSPTPFAIEDGDVRDSQRPGRGRCDRYARITLHVQ